MLIFCLKWSFWITPNKGIFGGERKIYFQWEYLPYIVSIWNKFNNWISSQRRNIPITQASVPWTWAAVLCQLQRKGYFWWRSSAFPLWFGTLSDERRLILRSWWGYHCQFTSPFLPPQSALLYPHPTHQYINYFSNSTRTTGQNFKESRVGDEFP